VSVSFGGIRAVTDVSFEVEQGDLVGIVGPNGAGKTTLLNAITQVVRPGSGRVVFNGRSLAGLATADTVASGLTRTFQSPEHFHHFTSAQYVALGRLHLQPKSVLGHGLGLRRSRRSEVAEAVGVRRLLAEFGLQESADVELKSLPYGTQKLVDCVRALASEPSCLLLDEPMSGVAVSERSAVSSQLRKINDQGVTLVVIDHDVPFIRRLCRRLLVMVGGQLLADGSPDEVLSRPEVIAAYLGVGQPAPATTTSNNQEGK
jgi:branched-chain amino acid transport system ATP-binding protein